MSGSKSVVSLKLAGAAPARDGGDQAERAERLKLRAERDLAARHEAERLLESKSLELFAANQRLVRLNANLEHRVEARTRQLDEAPRAAVEIGTPDPLTGSPTAIIIPNGSNARWRRRLHRAVPPPSC